VRSETTPQARPIGRERPPWRAVAIPTEHGGWGLTLEPVVLGLLLAGSWAGAAIGVAAFLAFLLRTPLKLAMVDRRRNRALDRTRLATRFALIELLLLTGLAFAALVAAGWNWLVPVAIAAPLVAIELWFDIRSRSRRLIPELCGAVGISAVAASIVIAGDGSTRLAIAAWMILAARAIASIPFVRTQIARLHRGSAALASTDAFQLSAGAIALAAVAVDDRMVVGAGAVLVLAATQAWWTRRRYIPAAKVIGLTQMALGFALVAATAAGTLIE
jgi:hypothetical protein